MEAEMANRPASWILGFLDKSRRTIELFSERHSASAIVAEPKYISQEHSNAYIYLLYLVQCLLNKDLLAIYSHSELVLTQRSINTQSTLSASFRKLLLTPFELGEQSVL